MSMVLSTELYQSLQDGDPFAALMRMQGEVYRSAQGRQTIKVAMQGQTYFIKQHHGVSYREIIKNCLRARWPVISAKNEWRALQQLPQLGIATMSLSGFGKKGINPVTQQSFVMTKSLQNTDSLETICSKWPAQRPTYSFKKALVEKVADITRRLHSNGFHHCDLYLCHFLLDLTQQNESPLRLYLIDLHRVKWHKNLPARWIIKDLSGLYFSSCDIGLTKTDIWRFLMHYYQTSPRAILQEKQSLLHAIAKRSAKLKKKYQRMYPLKSNACSQRKADKKGYMNIAWHECFKENNLMSFATWWTLPVQAVDATNRRARSGYSNVGRATLRTQDGHKRDIYIKKQENFTSRTLRHPIKGAATFAREFRWINRFLDLGIGAVKVVYYAQHLSSGNRQAILVSEALADYCALDDYREKNHSSRNYKERQAIIIKLAQTIRHLHDKHIIHNHLYGKHVFVKVDAGTIDIRLIDLENCKWRLTRKQCVLRDLCTLYMRGGLWSRAECLRFLMAYWRVPRANALIKRWAKLIVTRSQARAAKRRLHHPETKS